MNEKSRSVTIDALKIKENEMIVNKIQKLSRGEFLELEESYIRHLREYFVHYLDGKIIKKKEDYLTYFKEVYNFPDYYGNNYNAFIDCMRDLDFREEQGFILIIYNFSKLLKKYPPEKENFIEALKYIMFRLDCECLTTSGGRNHLKSFDVYLIDEDLSSLQFKDILMEKNTESSV